MSLAERLRVYREQCGFSQQQIANNLRIHRATYSYYELGRTEPSVENLIKLSQIFNVTIEELLGMPAKPSHVVRDPGPSVDTDRLDRLVGTSKIGDLTNEEKLLIISYRTLTAEQRSNLIETMTMMGLKSENQQ